MLLMIDNYDSFTYNVVQYLGELGSDITVFRNDVISIQEIQNLSPRQIVISPGPCTPPRSQAARAARVPSKTYWARLVGAATDRSQQSADR